jgi:hypothetical protein
MALSINVSPGETFDGDKVTLSKLRNAANPTITIEGNVGASDIEDSAVTTAKIADGAVTTAKLASDLAVPASNLAGIADGKVLAGSSGETAATAEHELTGLDLKRGKTIAITLSEGQTAPTSGMVQIRASDGTTVKATAKVVPGKSTSSSLHVYDLSTYSPENNDKVYVQGSQIVLDTTGDAVFDIAKQFKLTQGSASATVDSVSVSGSDKTVTLIAVTGFFGSGEVTVEYASGGSTSPSRAGSLSTGAAAQLGTVVHSEETSAVSDIDLLHADIADAADTGVDALSRIDVSASADGQVLTSQGPGQAAQFETLSVPTPKAFGMLAPFCPSTWLNDSTNDWLNTVQVYGWKTETVDGVLRHWLIVQFPEISTFDTSYIPAGTKLVFNSGISPINDAVSGYDEYTEFEVIAVATNTEVSVTGAQYGAIAIAQAGNTESMSWNTASLAPSSQQGTGGKVGESITGGTYYSLPPDNSATTLYENHFIFKFDSAASNTNYAIQMWGQGIRDRNAANYVNRFDGGTDTRANTGCEILSMSTKGFRWRYLYSGNNEGFAPRQLSAIVYA